ncbi:MAG: hypothetical protein PVI58_14170 [Desulfobacterales bacterium]|jgi:hypothetical protein
MDKISQELLQALSETGGRVPDALSSQRPASRTPEAQRQDGDHDRWRILLVELAYLFNTALRGDHYREDAKAAEGNFRQLSKILDELDQMAVHDGWVRFDYRGRRRIQPAKPADYVIQFGNITVDVPGVISLIDRMGIRLKHLEGRLVKSFETLADHGFSRLMVKLPGESPKEMAALRTSLQVLSGFNRAVEKKSAIVLIDQQRSYSQFPVYAQSHQPDANLTLLAAVNQLDQDAIAMLLVQATDQISADGKRLPIIDAIFKIKGLRQRLTRPPIQVAIDPASRFQAAPGAIGSDGDLQKNETELKADPSVLKDGVARLVKGKFGNSPQTASRIMKSIYGTDYRRINSPGLGQRLKLVTDLLNRMQKTPGARNVTAEVLRRIRTRMDQVPDEILGDFIVTEDELKFWSGSAETTVSKVDKDLLKIIDHSKNRSDARRQRRSPLTPEKDYADPNFEAIASDFGISPQDTAAIIRLFKSCFDGQNDFLRSAFEKKVSQFAAYKKKVFEILWEFLKETSRRSNRLPLLYSLQLLVRETKQPIQAIKLLLAYFIQDPGTATYADRNAIMLVNQFMRSYIKESDMDIEMTPDEVLRVRGGLDKHAVNYAIWKIDVAQEVFLEKILSIRKKLVEAMEPETAIEPLLPARFLLALEREVHIFLSLVGGKTSLEVLRSALNIYGNPASQIYHLKESTNLLEPLMLHLTTIIRGFVRNADKSDLDLLAEVKIREAQFRALHEDLRYHALLRQVMGSIDERFKF